MQLARVSFVLLVLASSVPALAVEQPAAPAVPAGKTVALPPLSSGYDPAAAAAYLQSPLWSEWNARHGGRWTAQLDTLTGVPRRVWGGALPWISGPANALRGVPPAQLEAVARRFIAENPHLFGAAPSRLRFVPALASPTADGHMHYAAFDYVVDGVPVDHARLVFAVNNGNLIYWSATNIAAVPAVTTPTLSAEQALRLARAHLGAEAPVADAPSLRLVPRAAPAGLSYQLTYALALRASSGETLGALVDAHSGAVLAFGDASRYLDPPSRLAGRVEGGVRRALATDTEVVRGLPELRVDTAAGPATTNANGGLDFFGGTLTSRLEGRYVRVVCEDCLQSEQDPAQGFGPLATSFGVPWLSFGTGGRDVVEPLRATRSYANGTSTPAARAAYYNINAAHALVR